MESVEKLLSRTKLVVLVYLIFIGCIVHCQKGKDRERGAGRRRREAASLPGSHRSQKLALDAWAASLDPIKDYNASDWRYQYRSVSTTDYFDHFLRRLSKIFDENNAVVNFAMIGACDGITDPTIKYRFLKYDHWRAVFVEPMSINYNDLVKYLEANGALNRSHVMRAAATSACESPTIKVERPLYEEKNASIPHWLRRQIGAIVPKNRDKPRAFDWAIEEVACVTAADVLADWAKAMPTSSLRAAKRRRPHILKIDVEGHDFQVLTSFIGEDTSPADLPLLVEFEAKSIASKFPEAKALMEKK